MPDATELKRLQRVMWATGDYERVGATIRPVGERVVARAGVAPGDHVLDVACGTGNATLPAARAAGPCGRVVGLDLTPELLALARASGVAEGLEVDWIEGDAEDLPFPDASFDAVLSTFGAMFAPRHAVVAAELARVTRPGGRIALCNWTREGAVGELFGLIGAHVPPRPGAPDPLAWGDEEHVRALFAEAPIALELHRETVAVRFDSVAEALDVYTTAFGPIALARPRLEAEGSWDALRADLARFLAEHGIDSAEGTPYAYLAVRGRRER